MSDLCQDEERNAFATLERVQVRLSDLLQRAQLARKRQSKTTAPMPRSLGRAWCLSPPREAIHLGGFRPAICPVLRRSHAY